MSDSYKILTVKGAQGVTLEQESDTRPAPYFIKIKACYSLVSPGTEYHYVQECTQNNSQLRLGYCSCGIVESIGDHVNTGIKPGDRVIAMGWQKAVHAEKIFVPQNLCCKIPDELPFEDAVFANLAATAMHAIHRAELVENDTILVIGGGLVGQLLALYAQLKSAKVYLSDLLESRMNIASKGAVQTVPIADWENTFEKQLTKVFICINGDADQVFSKVFKLLNPSGNGIHRSKIVGVGRFTAKIDFNVGLGNIDIVFAARCGEGYRDIAYETGQKSVHTLGLEKDVQQNLQDCLALINEQKITLRHLHSKTILFSHITDQYLTAITDKNVLGILIKYF